MEPTSNYSSSFRDGGEQLNTGETSNTNKIEGPVLDTLMPGEAVAVKNKFVSTRKGRGSVKVRIVGDASFGWLEGAIKWGCHVEIFVCSRVKISQKSKELYPGIDVVTPSKAAKMQPRHGKWEGIVLSTIDSKDQWDAVVSLLNEWKPSMCLIVWNRNALTRRANHVWPEGMKRGGYAYRQEWLNHSQFGGVTTSCWRMKFISRMSTVNLSIDDLTATMYARSLQTALDDTVGSERGNHCYHVGGKVSDKLDDGVEVIGSVYTNGEGVRPVYAATGLLLDFSLMKKEERRNLWVECKSVFSTKGVLRRIRTLELLSAWDYAGKICYSGMTDAEIETLLDIRLESPPGKIIMSTVNHLCEQMLKTLQPHDTTKIECSLPELVANEGPLPGIHLEGKATQRVKAAIADDANVDLDYWAVPGETEEESKAREVLRRFAHRYWRYNLKKETSRWLDDTGRKREDVNAAEDCLRRCSGSDYWEWHRGSRLHFWRIPEECNWRRDARDGAKFWHLKEPPKGLHFRNIPATTREGELQMRHKIFQLWFRGYIEAGPVDLVTPRFPVEKAVDETTGAIDVRTVWDSKKNGLNATLWAPKFCLDQVRDAEELLCKWLTLPVGHYLQAGSPQQDYTQDESLFIKSYQFDNDVGQMFNNFLMHVSERHSHGIRYIHTQNDGSVEEETILRCCALSFGCLCSPYLSVQGEDRIMELCMGNPSDNNNVFQWDHVKLNLPWTQEYDPSMPRVLLLRSDGELATRKVFFVDDIHGATRSRNSDPATQAQRQLAKRMNYYGNQDAARKRRHGSLTPGSWNGVIIHCDLPYPMKSTTTKKWTRGVDSLEWVWNHFDLPTEVDDPLKYISDHDTMKEDKYIDTGELRRIAGLWVHITEVYSEGRCFLKGFFNALESFRWGRDRDGWRLDEAMTEARELEDSDASHQTAASGYPINTRVTFQLILHVHALRKLFYGARPREVLVRPKDKHNLRYMLADASADGFGTGVQYPDMTIDERDGLWTDQFSLSSSNLREASGIANRLKRDISAGKHDGCEVWVGTDNAVWAAVCNKGMSSVRHLFQLWVDICLLCHEHGVFLHVFHISGDRMIDTGMDGLSRGDRDTGFTLGYDMRSFIPVAVSAFDYEGNKLEAWCKLWMGEDYSPPLKPEEWFLKGHQPGVHVWAPPPGAARVVLRQLASSRHKRPEFVTHVVLIPRLLYQEEWRTRFEKEVDIWFPMEPGEFWPCNAFQPLMIGLSFPLYSTYPWQLKQERDKVVEIGRALRTMSKRSNLQVGHYLRKLWSNPRAFPTMW